MLRSNNKIVNVDQIVLGNDVIDSVSSFTVNVAKTGYESSIQTHFNYCSSILFLLNKTQLYTHCILYS